MLLHPLMDNRGNRRLALRSHHLERLLVAHRERQRERRALLVRRRVGDDGLLYFLLLGLAVAAYFSNIFAMARPPLIIYTFAQLYIIETHLSIRNTPLTCGYSFGNPAASRTVPTRARVAFAALPRRSNSATDLPAAPA